MLIKWKERKFDNILLISYQVEFFLERIGLIKEWGVPTLAGILFQLIQNWYYDAFLVLLTTTGKTWGTTPSRYGKGPTSQTHRPTLSGTHH